MKPKGLEAEVAIKVADLVTYQDGSIVSREIVKKPTGTVTIFAFDEGQGVSEHTAPFDALVQVLEGEAEITIAGKLHRVQGGQMIFMPGWERFSPHALQLFEHRMTAASAGTNRQRLPKTHYGAAPDPAAQFRL